MYRTPFAGIRVPDVDDTDIATAMTNMLTDIEYEIGKYSSVVDEITRRRGARVDGGAVALPVSVYVSCQFASEIWDTDNYFNIASPTVLSVGTGVFLASGSAIVLGGGVLSTVHIRINGSVAGAISANSGGPFNTATSIMQSTVGIFASTAAQTLTLDCYQKSAGAGQIASSEFRIAKLSEL
jgi:hypothetical protein